MTTTIAVAGKGGTGKTTLAGLLIRRLVEAQASPMLAIDADPASNLNTVLGLAAREDRRRRPRGDQREGARQPARGRHRQARPARLRDQLEPRRGRRRRPAGHGPPRGRPAATAPPTTCCARIVDRSPTATRGSSSTTRPASSTSRGARRATSTCCSSSATPRVRGITTAGRVRAVLDELKTKVGKHYLIVNRAAHGLTPELETAIAEQRLESPRRPPRRPAGRGVRRVRPPDLRAPRRQRAQGRVQQASSTRLPFDFSRQGGRTC